ncbi:TIGR01212 family radical SAM protein [Treponema sp.]|uniref:TIGR01212 family radical SAM protein n=1 Tax=Treponema sp. TaxID=166 RepID=UPI00388FB28B
MNYLSASEFYKKIFGHKVYKICLDAGCTCPNRDGTKDTRGCIFCSALGSGEFSADRNLCVTEQIKNAETLVSKKIKPHENNSADYIAYFQNFSNTYGDEDELVKKYIEALENKDICGLAIATRPGCLKDSMLQKINELTQKEFLSGTKQKRKYFSIEFGLQTSNEKTAEYIRRHFTNKEYSDTITRIKKTNPEIHIVTHIIFGLPGETENDMLETVKFAVSSGTDGIKIQVLNVLDGTDLKREYENKKFDVLSMEEYFKIVKKALELIPHEIVIHRLTGDGAKKILIAPEWIKNKRKVMNELRAYLK